MPLKIINIVYTFTCICFHYNNKKLQLITSQSQRGIDKILNKKVNAMKKHHLISKPKELLKFLKVGGLATVLFILSGPLLAQEDTREDLHFGIKAGTNYSNVWDDRGDDFRADGKFGFAAGIWLGIPIGTYLGVQPELQLAQKGFRADGTLLGSEYSMTRTTTHLDIPLLFQFKPIPYLTIVGGPHYSFLLSEKDSYSWGDNMISQEEEFDNDNIRKNMFGLAFGLDVIIDPFVLSGRAGWDLTQNHGDGNSSTPRYKNRWIQIMAGFQF